MDQLWDWYGSTYGPYMEVIWPWYGLVAFIAYPYHVFDMGLLRIWYKSIHIPYDLLWEIHGFLIPFHNNFAMGMIEFYMGMIWEHDMEFISFLMCKLWEWYGCNNYIILGMVWALVFRSHTKPMLTSNIQMLDANTCGFGMGWKQVAIPFPIYLRYGSRKLYWLAYIVLLINMQKIFKNTIHK
jgi:hypothetical protein